MVQYRDWGVRSSRWTGIRSAMVEVGGHSVHYLAAAAQEGVSSRAPIHLLVHPLAAGGTFMLDLIGPLTACGPVVAPDLPGNLFGHTSTPHVRAARIEPNARFLRAFTGALGLDRVIVHGWSMGGAVAIRFAAGSPDRVERLVLANPPLPAALSMLQRLGWQTVGRLAVAAGEAAAPELVRLWGGWAIDRKLAYLEQAAPGTMEALGGDPSRIAADSMALWIEQIAELRSHTSKMAYAATAFASVVRGIFIDQKPVLDAIDRIAAPVLLLWGAQDPLVVRPMIDRVLARRPDWTLHVLESAGHAAPVELPGEYVAAVRRWLARIDALEAPTDPPRTTR